MSVTVLEFYKWFRTGDYMIVVTDMAGPGMCDGGPWRAVEEWLAKHGSEYEFDTRSCDWWGQNVTLNVNRFLRRK